jgi:dTDP-4-dehydrorhamnose 3,5-epimerase
MLSEGIQPSPASSSTAGEASVPTIIETIIDDLRMEENLYTQTLADSYLTVVASEGPGMSDVVTHDASFTYATYGVHIGQTDRLTFFGDMSRTITGHFVDCRAGSPTLHQHVKMTFRPDPRRRLHIGRGIAHTFDGLEDIVTRDEPEWFLATGNPDYRIANDVINVDRLWDLADFPAVRVNDYPIPRAAYEFMLKVQHTTLREVRRYPTRFPMIIDGERRYVVLYPKERLEP